MRSVMVVDDEKWIRRGLIQAIPWEPLGLTLVGEAGDGEDGYQLALELRPDILFLDMRMPGLDGKQLLAMLDDALPDLLTIVVSGYSDFEYTKEAIRHRAFDYLLKPVKKEELAGVLEKALAELDRRERDNRGGTEAAAHDGWLSELLLGREKSGDRSEENRSDVADEGRSNRAEQEEARKRPALPAAWLGRETAVFVAKADRYVRDGAGLPAILRALRLALDKEKPFRFGGQWSFALAPAPGGRSEAACALAADRLTKAELDWLLANAQSSLKSSVGVGFSLAVVASGPASAGALRESYYAASAALGGRRLEDEEAIVRATRSAAQAEAARTEPEGAYSPEKEKAFLLALQLGGEQETLAAFGRLFAEWSGPGATVERLRRGAELLLHALERQLLAEGLGDGLPLREWTERLRERCDAESVRELFAEEIVPSALKAAGSRTSDATQGERVVREVLQLIEAHYDQPLSLQQIAESRFVHPDYLSRLFKRTTGHNFVDYLTDKRISEAIELMKAPGYKNYEIAQKVGYEDYRYFSQIFKKKTGRTIGEFRSAECGAKA